MMMDGLLTEKFAQDNRQILHEFSIPDLGRYGWSPPMLSFWGHLAVLLTWQSVINAIMALLIWFLVVKQRGTPTALMATYGIIIPLALAAPFYSISLFGLQNVVLMVSVTAIPPLIALRCLEALHGTSRAFVEQSLSCFLLYHVSPVAFVFDRKSETVKKATFESIIAKVKLLVPGLIETTILLNFCSAGSFAPFLQGFESSSWHSSFPSLLLNNLTLAYLCEIYLEFGTRSAAIAISLMTGLETLEVNDNPLSGSTSVAEFWGARWNRLVGELLRTCIFKPALKLGCSKPFAVLATFFVSGLYHEYVFMVLHWSNAMDFVPRYGYQTAFFMWNGGMLILEQILMQEKSVADTWSRLWRPIRTALVLMTTLPVAHWFLDEYVAGGVFEHFAVAFPLIRKMKY